MYPPLTEAALANALADFARSCVVQLGVLGLPCTLPDGCVNLRLTDDPIREKSQQRSQNGRCWFRRGGRDSYWPHSDSPGVYIFFNSGRRACYVGKSERAVGGRLSVHSGPAGSDGKYAMCEFPEAEYVVVVPFKDAPFLAPAFESFLLANFDVPRNRQLARREDV